MLPCGPWIYVVEWPSRGPGKQPRIVEVLTLCDVNLNQLETGGNLLPVSPAFFLGLCHSVISSCSLSGKASMPTGHICLVSCIVSSQVIVLWKPVHHITSRHVRHITSHGIVLCFYFASFSFFLTITTLKLHLPNKVSVFFLNPCFRLWLIDDLAKTVNGFSWRIIKRLYFFLLRSQPAKFLVK